MNQERFQGCLMGLAVGDAVGTTLEFKPRGTFTPITDMVGGGPFGLQAGQWTDDTSMALCLATSLVEKQGFDAADQMRRYLAWYQKGYLSSTGSCFDIGNTVRQALHQFEQTGEPFSGSTAAHTAGNGSLMRLAPIPIFYAHDPAQAVHYAAESSRTTHGAAAAVDACRYFTALILRAFAGHPKADLFLSGADEWGHEPLTAAIDAIRRGSFQYKQPPDIRGTGYVVDSLEAALWAFWHSHDFREGCLLAANLGDDADTTAAIYGQLAGAYYGLAAIPASWRTQITLHDQILTLANQLSAESTEKGTNYEVRSTTSLE